MFVLKTSLLIAVGLIAIILGIFILRAAYKEFIRPGRKFPNTVKNTLPSILIVLITIAFIYGGGWLILEQIF